MLPNVTYLVSGRCTPNSKAPLFSGPSIAPFAFHLRPRGDWSFWSLSLTLQLCVAPPHHQGKSVLSTSAMFQGHISEP